jgi:hypothetical protein
MVMTRPLFRITLRIVIACRHWGLLAIGVSTVPSVLAMPTVAEQVHRDKPGKEQHPNPVL